ncbi:MAG: DUF3313 domain-containing protein [Verrucomicrobia bacterium]|nr:DUF3313 domain-containing protein [Verrucomicrobiota bacterium]
MKAKTLSVFSLMVAGLLIAGCSTSPKSGKYSSVPESEQLRPDVRFPHALVYIKEGTSFAQYSKFIVDPVEIYRGTDASWHKGKVTEQAKQELAQFARAEFVRVLGPKYPVVDQPGPGVLRIKLTLADVELTTPALAVVSHFSPGGMGMNLLGTGAGMQGSFMGSVTMSVELRDAQSDTVLAAALTKQAPLAVDVTKTFGNLSAARAGITETAVKFMGAMDRAHATVTAPGP